MKNNAERIFCTALQKWCIHNLNKSTAIEAKICKEKKFYYRNIASHQVSNLYNSKHQKIIYKISDFDSMTQKPFDIFMLCKSDAYIALMFIKPRNKKFYLIDIDRIIDDMKAGNNGLDEERAKILGLNCELK